MREMFDTMQSNIEKYYVLCVGEASAPVAASFDLRLRCFVKVARPSDVEVPISRSRLISFSVGDPSVRLERLDERFMLELTLSIDGYCCISPFSPSDSSMGKQVSTIASRQFTNSSLLSAVLLY